MSDNGTPTHWKVVRLADIAEVRLGRQRSPKRAVGDHMRPYMRAANVTWKGIDIGDVKEMDFTPKEFQTYELRAGDILLAEASGSSSEVGKAAIWRNEVPGACFQNTLIRVRAPRDLVPFLHLHFVKDAVTGAFAKSSRGVGIHHLGAEAMSGWSITLPPPDEQGAIVAAIESHFSRLDAATATLERVQRNLERYRASVLKAAVEGRLVPTEAELAKKEGRSHEPASVLLKRILAERRRRWEEAELAKLKAKGKPPTDDRWKARYEEPAAPDTDGLPGLPEGWCWATADQLAWSIRNGCSIAPREKDGVRILRISAVRPLACDLNDVRFLPGPVGNYEEFLVQPGDLLFTRYNGTRSLVGVCALVQHLPAPTVHPDKLIRVQLLPGCDAGFVELATNVGASRKHVESRTRTTAGQAGVSGADIKSLPVPLPPAAEQARIREASDELLTVASSVSATVLASLARSARTRQSILKWAFEGRLSDQHRGTTPAPTAVDNPATMRRSASTEPSARR